jgi:hypothetical protein
MSKHSKTEYQILAGWATNDCGIYDFDHFCEYLIREHHINSEDVREDWDLIKSVFLEVRKCRTEEKLNAIKFWAKSLSDNISYTLRHELLTERDVDSILQEYGLMYYMSIIREIDIPLNDK